MSEDIIHKKINEEKNELMVVIDQLSSKILIVARFYCSLRKLCFKHEEK